MLTRTLRLPQQDGLVTKGSKGRHVEVEDGLVQPPTHPPRESEEKLGYPFPH